MNAADTISALGYEASPNFLRPGGFTWDRVGGFAHVLRKAEGNLSLRGVYTLDGPGSAIPLVYVCEAVDESRVREIHRLVWNQDMVPCVIVAGPESVSVYSGFEYGEGRTTDGLGLLESAMKNEDLAAKLRIFASDTIDSGRTWNDLAARIRPDTRLNVRLLANLKKLDAQLQSKDLPRALSHALIGKFVYLRYLRDRGILSTKKLARWGFDETQIFGPKATVGALEEVTRRLDEWLNGRIFPIDFSRKGGLRAAHVQWVSSIFAGSEIERGGDHQLHLDFPAYDFSFIPVETLSVIYEQFLHDTPLLGGRSKGADKGAYYTPIPVVNLMLSQLDNERPLRRGMKVFDPACGSGAFVVQCYRRLIEREFPGPTKPKPGQLRELLQESIFGIDRDPDACAVTELSLLLTLLDYVDPPDLEPPLHNFQLPSLRGENIVEGDFFTASPPSRAPEHRYDWVIGNPPWRKVSLAKPGEDFIAAAAWIKQHSKTHPVGNNEVGRAFAWKVEDHLAPDGHAALLLPAMTLFETAAKSFRSEFFAQFEVTTVANFANLAEVLANGRFRVPAAAFFFQHRGETDPNSIRVFSPLVANQEITRPREAGKRIESWVITIDSSDVRQIPIDAVENGDSLPWKIASWGCPADMALLHRLRRKFPSFATLESEGILLASEGLQYRAWSKSEALEEVREIAGKQTFDPKKLAKWRNVFALPESSLSLIPENQRWVRKGRSALPLSICRSPHVILSAARNFAVFSDEFVVVPPRQIGIISPSGDVRFLKALALFLSSDFARYHEFLSSSQLGVQRGRSTLHSLRKIAMPIGRLSHEELDEWGLLHDRLAQTKPRHLRTSALDRGEMQLDFEDGASDEDSTPLLLELNERVANALGLSNREAALIRSLVRTRMYLNDGNVGNEAIRPPDDDDLRAYANALKEDLDGFLGLEPKKGHELSISRVRGAAMLRVRHPKPRQRCDTIQISQIPPGKDPMADILLLMLTKQSPQWTYFRRSLRCYHEDEIYFLKPLQRFQWTVAQATLDCGALIADHLAAKSKR